MNLAAVDTFLEALVQANPQVLWNEALLATIWRNIVEEQTLKISGDDNEQLQSFAILPNEVGLLKDVCYVNLSWTNLAWFPENFVQLTKLKQLSVEGTQLSTIPSFFCAFTALESIDLRDTEFDRFPLALTELPNLRHLKFDWSPIELPTEIGKLTQLEVFDLRSDQMSVIPIEIGQLKQLKQLKLAWGTFEHVPTEIGQLSQLQELDLSGTSIKHLPPEIGNLAALERLNLANPHSSWPPRQWRPQKRMQDM